MLQFPTKLSGTTFIRCTTDTKYLGDRCRCNIRVQRPQKPPSNEFRLIMLQIPIKLQGTTFMRSTLDPGTLETFSVAIFVFIDPKNPRETRFGNYVTNSYKTLGDDVYTVHTGLPIPLRPLPLRYPCLPPEKPLSNKFRLIMLQIPIKL